MNTEMIADLTEAVELMRQRALDARRTDDARWMVDQSEEDGLVVGEYTPDDVDNDGVVGGGCVAFFAYPDDAERRAYDRAMPVGSHMAALDPAVALLVAAWMQAHLIELKRVGGLLRACDSPTDVQRAVQLARTYLRKD